MRFSKAHTSVRGAFGPRDLVLQLELSTNALQVERSRVESCQCGSQAGAVRGNLSYPDCKWVKTEQMCTVRKRVAVGQSPDTGEENPAGLGELIVKY